MKKQFWILIFIAFLASMVFNLMFGGLISAKLSTVPIFGKLGLFKANAPIVINNREVVRAPGNQDIVDAGDKIKNKISTLVAVKGDNITNLGNLVNWTEDGYLVGSQKIFVAAPTGASLGVITDTGDFYPVDKTFPDEYSGLVVVKISARGLIVSNLSDYKNLRVGQQVVAVDKFSNGKDYRLFSGNINNLNTDRSMQILESDRFQNGYGVGMLIPTAGAVYFDLDGKFLGLDGYSAILPGDMIKTIFDQFITNNSTFKHSAYGFSYQYLSDIEAKVLQTSSGYRVMGMANNKPASTAGLKVGDIITSFGQKDIKDGQSIFSAMLQKYVPGQSVEIKILREGIEQTLTISAANL